MKLRSLVRSQVLSLAVSALLLPAALPSVAHAKLITDFTDSVTANSSTQFGRPSRNGVPQDWAGDEAYPGVNPLTVSTLYFYKTYTFAASSFAGAPYVEITFDDKNEAGNVFLSAYAAAYDPAHRATNWLGDLGIGGDPFGNTGFFDVILPTGDPLVLVVNTAGAAGGGLFDPYEVNVMAFGDSSFGPPVAATPEPSSLILLGTGLLGTVTAMRRRLR